MINKGDLINNRYEVVDKIGEGGMSNVYRAKDHVLGRYVAIKVLKEEFAQDANFIVKFRTEAQSAAGLEHPNIVNIYDVGCEAGNHYIVMECVEGITLKTYIEKKGQLSFKEALSIAIQVGRGIQAAHAKGIIHRDIKPQNVIISTEGKVKVTDFGIARMASANTINAEVMGSVHYTSPEQARNGFVTNTSDIYSLGIVMYEMVTGRVPFDGESVVAIAIQHLQEEMTAPSTYAPNLPISLEKIILKCTQKSPDRRYASMDELLADLRQSLLTPDKDFVVIPAVAGGQTRVVSQDEMSQIQQKSSVIKKEEPVFEEEDEDDEYEDDDEYDYDDEEEGRFLNKKMEKAVTIMGIVAAIVIVILVVYLIGSFLGVFSFGGLKKPQSNNPGSVISEMQKEDVTMIDVTGKTYDEAKTALEALGLTIVQGGTEESTEFEPGQIISQDVKEGTTVTAGTKVTVIVCVSAEKAAIPNVVGLDVDIAKAKLADAGFEAVPEYEFSTEMDAGMIIRQDPGASTELNKGDKVTIYISQGTEKIKVPNVVGKTEADAKAALQAAGFSVGTVTQENSATVAAGQVISQSVKGDTFAATSEAVNLVVSKGAQATDMYTCKATLNAPTVGEGAGQLPPGSTLISADIELSVEGEDEPLEIWNDVSTFPFAINRPNIEGYSSGTITIVWTYVDASGVEQAAVQESGIAFIKQ